MVLNKIRSAINPILENIGRYFSYLGAPAWVWTLFGLLLSLISMLFYSTQAPYGALLGGSFFLLSGLMDVVDGAVAKFTNTVSKLGSFIDSTADRLGEILVSFGLLVGRWAQPDFVFLMITFSILVSYVRAKGDSLGLDLKGSGIGERAERMLVLSFSSILGYTFYGVLIVSALAIYTFIERSTIIMRKLRK
jgi:archaetidylinositol phosphate synthase